MGQVTQLNADSLSKFWVESQNFDSEGHLVGDALTGAVTTAKKLQVLDPVVLPVAVDVVDGLIGSENPTNVLLHNVAVFKNSVFLSSNCRGHGNPYVPMSFNVFSKFPSSKSSRSISNLKVNLTLLIAKLLFPITNPSRTGVDISKHGVGLAALDAGEKRFFFGIQLPPFSGAFSGTIKRVFAKFFPVCGQIRLHHGEGLTAGFASKWHRCFARRWPSKVAFCYRPTSAATEPPRLIARPDLKWLPTLLANFLNRHCFLPVSCHCGEYSGALAL